MRRALLLAIALLVMFPPSAWADVVSAAKAYRAGNYAAALGEFRALADGGQPQAQFALGLMYAEGAGVTKDYAAAAAWYRRAAESGFAQGQYNLGVAYYTGIGVPRNYARAVYWYEKAARQGDARSQNNMGYMYESGKGVAQDFTRAAEWYRLAAEGGNVNAQVNLGNAYRTGRGVERDHEMAIAWLRKAVDQWETNDPLKLWIVESPQSIKPYAEAVGAPAAIQVAEGKEELLEPSAGGATVVVEAPAVEPVADEPVTQAALAEEPAPEPRLEAPVAQMVAVTSRRTDAASPTWKRQYEIYIGDDDTPSPTEGFRVQLGAFSNPENAQRGWSLLRDAHPDLLGEMEFDLSLHISKVDLGEEIGVVFRVQAGPFPEETEAEALCSELRNREVGCFLVRP
ncbi:MAG: SEL1-like repeat protein [Proteobacteria bacterium]|nr:SEL1-like repeat protein [Pseudomonadota bacterium]